MQKITKGTSPEVHNVAMHKTNHTNNFYGGYLQYTCRFFVAIWANNILMCHGKSVYIFTEIVWRQLPCKQGNSAATIPSCVVQDDAHKGGSPLYLCLAGLVKSRASESKSTGPSYLSFKAKKHRSSSPKLFLLYKPNGTLSRVEERISLYKLELHKHCSVIHSWLCTVFTHVRYSPADNSTVFDSAREIHVSQVTS